MCVGRYPAVTGENWGVMNTGTRYFGAAYLLLFAHLVRADGIYVGLGTGVMRFDDRRTDLVAVDSPLIQIDDEVAFADLLVGYELGKRVSVEGSFVRSINQIKGSATRYFGPILIEEPVETRLHAFDVSIVGAFPLGSKTSLIGRAGYHYLSEDPLSPNIASQSGRDDTGLRVGVGLRFAMSNAYCVEGAAHWYDSDIDSLWTVGIALQRRFSF